MRRASRGVALTVVLGLALVWSASVAAQGRDYFGRDQAPPAGSAWRLPGPVRAVVVQVAEWQGRFNRRLSAEMQALKDSGRWVLAGSIILAAFLYGVFHAAGPGHGKAVTLTYFLSRRARVLQGALMGGAIALTQAVSAVLIVAVLVLVLQRSNASALGGTVYLEMASYALIAAIGAAMLVGVATGRGACLHRHDHHAQNQAGGRADAPPALTELLPTAVAVGLRPCSGALIVLLFGLANGLFLVGVVATLFMALGVALTITALGLTAIGTQRLITVSGRLSPRAAGWVQNGLGLAGAGAITALGVVLLLATLQRSGLLA